MSDFIYNAAEKVKLCVSRHYTKLSVICVLFICVVFSPTSYAAGTSYIIPGTDTAFYFDYELEENMFIGTCKDTLLSTIPYDFYIAPPMEKIEASGSVYLSLFMPYDYNPEFRFYKSNGDGTGYVDYDYIFVDEIAFRDTKYIVYQIPADLGVIAIGGNTYGGGSGQIDTAETLSLTLYYTDNVMGDNTDVVRAIKKLNDDINTGLGSISSILGQTYDLQKHIDDILTKGSENTQSVIDLLSQNLNEFNTTVGTINGLETEAVAELDYVFTNYPLPNDIAGSYSSAFTWLSTNFGFINNFADDQHPANDVFIYYIYMPCLIGLAMFFVGRGGSIIGGLFRKPLDSNTTTVSTGYTVFDENGIRRSETSTHTRGGGGIFRR